MSPAEIVVKVYGLPFCPACQRLVNHLQSEGIAVDHVIVTQEEMTDPDESWRQSGKVKLLAASVLYEGEFPLAQINGGLIVSELEVKHQLAELLRELPDPDISIETQVIASVAQDPGAMEGR